MKEFLYALAFLCGSVFAYGLGAGVAIWVLIKLFDKASCRD